VRDFTLDAGESRPIERRFRDAWRDAQQQERRDYESQHEMLDDMRAEEILVAEQIDGRDEIEQENGYAGQKACRAAPTAGADSRNVADGQRRASDENRWFPIPTFQ